MLCVSFHKQKFYAVDVRCRDKPRVLIVHSMNSKSFIVLLLIIGIRTMGSEPRWMGVRRQLPAR